MKVDSGKVFQFNDLFVIAFESTIVVNILLSWSILRNLFFPGTQILLAVVRSSYRALYLCILLDIEEQVHFAF